MPERDGITMRTAVAFLWAMGAVALPGQEPGPLEGDAAEIAPISAEQTMVVPAGTRIPLVMVNSVSSRNSQQGDPVYMQSVYPVVVDGRMVIPAGTHVSGTVVRTKRPGRIKGRAAINITIDQMILHNGVIRDLSGRPAMLDGRSSDNLDRETGTVKGPGTKGEDAETIATAGSVGATIGVIAGGRAGRPGKGVGIGAAAGGAAGLGAVLMSRGRDAELARGTHIEMVLERDLRFTEDEIASPSDALSQPRPEIGPGPRPAPERNRRRDRGYGRRPFPL